MEKKIYLMPRRSGKSTLAEYEFNKDIENTMFVVYNNNMLQHIDSAKNHAKNFFTQRSDLRGFSFKKAVIDEYLLFDLKGLKNIYENLHLLGVKEVFIFTTNEQFDKDAVDWIKSLKLRRIYWRSSDGVKEMPNSIRIRFETNTGNKNDRMFEHLDKIHFNFLTDPNSKIIFKPNKYKPFDEPRFAEKVQKPPLGLMPFKVHNEIRLSEINEAILRYVSAGYDIPIEWVAEKQSLEAYLNEH